MLASSVRRLGFSTLVSFSVLSGCGHVQDKPDLVEGGECMISNEPAPLWACGGYVESDRYIGTGSAPLSRLGYDFSRKEAQTNARVDIAQQLESVIKAKLDTYQRSTGADEISSERVISQVARQTTEMTLKQTQQISYWQHPETEMIFVLMAVDKSAADAEITALLGAE